MINMFDTCVQLFMLLKFKSGVGNLVLTRGTDISHEKTLIAPADVHKGHTFFNFKKVFVKKYLTFM